MFRDLHTFLNLRFTKSRELGAATRLSAPSGAALRLRRERAVVAITVADVLATEAPLRPVWIAALALGPSLARPQL